MLDPGEGPSKMCLGKGEGQSWLWAGLGQEVEGGGNQSSIRGLVGSALTAFTWVWIPFSRSLIQRVCGMEVKSRKGL